MAAFFKELSSREQLDELISDSFQKPIALIKHSATCGTSAHVMHLLTGIDGEINVIVVQDQRELSNFVADTLQHRHHSPQAFVIRDGKTVYHATHYGIDPGEIEKRLRNTGE